MCRSSLSRSCRWLAWGLGSLGLWFALALPVSALPCLAETAERPCYRPPTRRPAVLVQLARTADRVTVLLHTAVTPVLAGEHSRVPLFHIPPAYRPPHLLHRELDARAVLETGTPDPAYPTASALPSSLPGRAGCPTTHQESLVGSAIWPTRAR